MAKTTTQAVAQGVLSVLGLIQRNKPILDGCTHYLMGCTQKTQGATNKARLKTKLLSPDALPHCSKHSNIDPRNLQQLQFAKEAGKIKQREAGFFFSQIWRIVLAPARRSEQT